MHKIFAYCTQKVHFNLDFIQIHFLWLLIDSMFTNSFLEKTDAVLVEG